MLYQFPPVPKCRYCGEVYPFHGPQTCSARTKEEKDKEYWELYEKVETEKEMWDFIEIQDELLESDLNVENSEEVG